MADDINTSDLEYLLKTMGQKEAVEQFCDQTTILDKFERRPQQYGGRNNWEIDLYANPTPAAYARSEGDSLPAAVAPAVVGANIGKATVYVPVKVTGHMLRAEKLTDSRLTKIANFMYKDAMRGLRLAVDRMICGSGDGFVGTVASAATVYITLSDTLLTRAIKDLPGTGLLLDIRNKTTGAIVYEGIKMTALNETTKVATFDTNVASATTTDGICVSGNVTAVSGAATCREVNSIQNIIGTGTYLGLSTTTYPWHKSYVKAMGNVIADAESAQEIFDEIMDIAPVQPDVWIAGRACTRKYFSKYSADRRFNTTVTDTGTSRLTFTPIGGNPINILGGRNVSQDEMYFIASEHMKLYYTERFQWRDWGGGGILHGMETEDALIGQLIFEGELASDCRRAHGKLTGCGYT